MKDSDNIARLEKLKPEYERLHNLRIRTEAELERAENDVKVAEEEAMAIANTKDENKIREIVRENYDSNTKKLDDFENAINEIKKQLAEIEE